MVLKSQQKKLSFDKELFKRSVLYNVKTLYRKTLEEADFSGGVLCDQGRGSGSLDGDPETV